MVANFMEQKLQQKKQIIYRHFRRLLRELDETIHYIELAPQNYETFSINNSNLIKETCGYIDSIYGLLELPFNMRVPGESNVSHLYRHFKEIKNEDFALITVRTVAGDRIPWKGKLLENRYKFTWWDANNSLKHAFYDERNAATFSDVIDSLGAFIILILFLFRDDDYPDILEKNDLIHALGPNEVSVKSYFERPYGSIEDKIWAKVRERTIANTQHPTPPSPTLKKKR